MLLERAIHSYALDLLIQRDFTSISVPSLVQETPLIGTGMFPKARDETYALPADDLYLAGTAEVALVGLHSRRDPRPVASLPITYAGISPCFRREIGSASATCAGLLRVHQFEKVEQFVLCAADAASPRTGTRSCWAPRSSILQALGLALRGGGGLHRATWARASSG